VDVGGVTVTYYTDEVASVEEESPTAPEPKGAKEPQTVPEPKVAPEPDASDGVSTEDPVVEERVGAAKPTEPLLPTATKRELILRFLDVFGTKRSMQENFKQILAQMPAEQALEFQAALDVEAVLEELVPIYEKHFTEEELRAYIKFYSTPNGQKLVRTIPLIMQESIRESADYLREILPGPKR
jgi:hypothetical protein